MAKKIDKQEDYPFGSGNLTVNAFSGNGHPSTITVKRGNALVAAGNNRIKDADAGPKGDPRKLSITANISRVANTKNVSFTVRLKDGSNSQDFIYTDTTSENVVICKVKIDLK